MPTEMPPFETDVFMYGDPLTVATVDGYTVAVFVDDAAVAALREDLADDANYRRQNPERAKAVIDGTVYWWFVYGPFAERIADSAEFDEYGNYYSVPDALADAIVYAYRQGRFAANYEIT